MKSEFRILFFILVIIVCLFTLSSCGNDYIYEDDTFIYRKVDGGYEIVRITDEDATDIVIPSYVNSKKVVAIGDNAINDHESVTSITIAKTVKKRPYSTLKSSKSAYPAPFTTFGEELKSPTFAPTQVPSLTA